MIKKIIFLVAALSAMLAAAVYSNNLILAPSGSSLHLGEVRAEGAIGMKDSNDQYYWLGVGLPQFEINLLSSRHPNTEDSTIVSGQWHFIPQTTLTPSVSLGVWDVFNDTHHGIAPYVVATKELITDEGIIKSLEVTGGVGFNDMDGLFGGAKLKLPLNLSLCAEYFSGDFNTSLGFDIGTVASVKLYRMDHKYYYGVEITPFTF